MQEKIQLSIDSPCAESWDRMQPNQEGRHCLSCQKTVVDFTLMSDQEILDWLATRQGPVCGRVQSGQLDRELVARPTPWTKGWPAVWRFLLAGFLVSSEARAQNRPATPPAVQVDRTADWGQQIQGKFAIAPVPRPDTLRSRQEEVITVGMVAVKKRHRRRKPENILADTVVAVRDTLATCGIGKKALAVFPNPVAHGGSITLSLRLDQGGKYIAQLFNTAGTLEQTMEIQGDVKTKTVLMNLPATLAAGIYMVRLSHPGSGKVYSREVVVL